MSEDTTAPLVSVRGVTHDYGKLRALDDLSIDVRPGATGLLGRNGAGKSTLIKILLGLLKPKSGSGTILGTTFGGDAREIRRRVGYVPERDAHVPVMTAIDYVSMMGELSGLSTNAAVQRAHEVLHYVALGEARYRAVDGFSAGMRQRLKLAVALVHDPDLLLLDEPTNGLDPKGRRYMLDLVAELVKSGISILVSTHLLPDVQEACENVAVVTGGRVVRQGTVEELTQGLDRAVKVRYAGEAEAFLAALERRRIEATRNLTSGLYELTLPEGATSRAVFEAARECGGGLHSLLDGRRSLEEVFLESVGEADADS